MSEKVIHEIRFIETDEGYRIEINGDKERLREMGFNPRMGFGPGMGFGHRMGFGPAMKFMKEMRGAGRRHRRHNHGFGPWAWCADWSYEEEEPEEPPKEA